MRTWAIWKTDLTREDPQVTFQQLIDFKDESEALYEASHQDEK